MGVPVPKPVVGRMKNRGCSVEGCNGKHEQFGLCGIHWRQTGEYRERQNKWERDKRSSDQVWRDRRNARGIERGRAARANPLTAEAIRERDRQSYQENPEPKLTRAICYRSGFSPELIVETRKLQHNRCCICRVAFGSDYRNKEHKDHFEVLDGVRVSRKAKGSTKVPRGLLCGSCNSAIGAYETYQRPAGLIIRQYEEYLTSCLTVHWI